MGTGGKIGLNETAAVSAQHMSGLYVEGRTICSVDFSACKDSLGRLVERHAWSV